MKKIFLIALLFVISTYGQFLAMDQKKQAEAAISQKVFVQRESAQIDSIITTMNYYYENVRFNVRWYNSTNEYGLYPDYLPGAQTLINGYDKAIWELKVKMYRLQIEYAQLFPDAGDLLSKTQRVRYIIARNQVNRQLNELKEHYTPWHGK